MLYVHYITLFYRIATGAKIPSIQLSALENMHYIHLMRLDNEDEARYRCFRAAPWLLAVQTVTFIFVVDAVEFRMLRH